MIDVLKFVGTVLLRMFRPRAALQAENVLLRQQLVVLKRSASSRIRLRNSDRLIFVWLCKLFPCLLDATVIFQPETLLRLHCGVFCLFWRWKSRRRAGRSALPTEIRKLLRQISRENPLWGTPRLHGELMKLRIEIAQSAVA